MKTLVTMIVALLVCNAHARAGNVLVVAPTGAPYADIQSAINASADGDVILVKSGTYPGFSIGDESLSVVAEVNANVNVHGGVQIGPAAASRIILISHLSVYAPAATTPALPALSADQVDGFLRIESCGVMGADGFIPVTNADGSPGTRITNCLHVVVARGYTLGGGGLDGDILAGPPPGFGGSGLDAVSSVITLYDVNVVGGFGLDGSTNYDGGHGGVALDASNSTVFASNGAFSGGGGGGGACCGGPCGFACGYGGNGGNSVHLSGASTLTVLDCTLLGGPAGPASPCGQCSGTSYLGQPGVGGGATTTLSVPGGGRGMNCTSVVREQGTITVTVTGTPGDQVGLYLSFLPGQQLIPAWNGVLAVSTAAGSGSRLVRIGTIGASGTLVRTFAQPDLGAGVQAQTRWLQIRVVDSSGTNVIGTPLAVVALDSAF